MHDVIELFGWFVFNVAIPLFAPLALLTLVSAPDFFRAYRRGVICYAVKDGQLFWAMIPMSASACYALASVVELAGELRQIVWMAMSVHAVLIVTASVLVVFATMDAHLANSMMLQRRTRMPWLSVWIAGISAVGHFACHTFLVRPLALA